MASPTDQEKPLQEVQCGSPLQHVRTPDLGLGMPSASLGCGKGFL